MRTILFLLGVLVSLPTWSASISVTPRAAIVGNYGLEITHDGTADAAWVYTNAAALHPQINVRWSMRLDALSFAAGGSMDVLVARDASATDLFRVSLIYDGSSWSVGAEVSAGGSWQSVASAAVPSTGAFQPRLEWVASTPDGSYALYINDVLAGELTDLDIGGTVRNVYLGAPTDSAAMTGGYLALDEVAMWSPGMPALVYVDMMGWASDPEDGDISASLQWVSSIDGPLGSGPGPFSVALSSGVHTITATATSSTGQTASSQVTITVNAIDGAPVSGIVEPQDGAIYP